MINSLFPFTSYHYGTAGSPTIADFLEDGNETESTP